MKTFGNGFALNKVLFGSIVWVCILVNSISAGAASYWVSPAGTGDGSSSSTPANYLTPSFWSTVQGQLSSGSVTVNFLSGSYTGGTLGFTNMGNPLNQLILTAVTPQGAVFQPNANPVIQFLGSQNIELNGMVITGPTTYWGVYCLQSASGTVPTRNIVINNCWFLNLTNAYYAAIGLLNGVRSIQILNCNFTNITDVAAEGHQHVIYAPHDNEDIIVSNCIAQDCLADYMRFRDDTEYVVVEDSTFISTKSTTAFPFLSAEQYNVTNSDAAGDEFFGTYFQISSNTFNYEASGGGPDSAMHFSDDGWSPQSYYCDLTSAQATALGNGSQSYEQSFLATNMGIIGSDIKMFGNTFLGASTYLMDYQYLDDGTNPAPNNGWTGDVNLYHTPDTSGATMAPVPVLRNSDFNRRGLLMTSLSGVAEDYQCLFRNWFANPEHTGILLSTNFYGTNNALRFNPNDSQEVYQWITPPGTNWTMDCLFAIGSAYTGTGTKFKVDLFHNDITGSKVSVGVNNSGQFGIYNGGTFTTLPGLGTVAFSVDNTGDGTYTDPGDILNVYRLRITGNYGASTPYVNIYTSNANDTNLDNEVTNLTDWVNNSPVSGQSSPETIAFYNYTAPVLVGQVSITNVLPAEAESPPIISQIPAPYAMINLYPGETPAFSVSATGTAPFAYQWFSNNVAVAGATNTVYVPAAISSNGVTSFYCTVTNLAGSTNSAAWLTEVVAAPAAAYLKAVLALNPMDYWPLNEAEQGGGDDGVIAYDYAGGNNGVYSNVVLGQLSYNPAGGAALFGSFVSSNSDAGQIDGPDFSMPAGSNAEFSVSAWVNGSGYAQTRGAGLVTKGYYSTGEEMSLNEASPGADFRFDVWSAADTIYAAGSAINATNASPNHGWYHLVGVCDEANGNLLLYVNGALAGQVGIPALSGIANSSGVPLTIGARALNATSGNNAQFSGMISDVAIYGYALSSNQIQTLYQAGALPAVNLTRAEGSLVINFTGTLLSSTNVAGPYAPVPGASWPTYTVPLTNSQMFYRATTQ